MPAHRHSSTARSHTAGPYKASIIVISSDEEEEPLPVPKRGSRKSRRSRAEGDILEILDETSVEAEKPELESLRLRCHKLEQERDALQKDNKHLSAAMNQLKANTQQNTLSISALDDALCCDGCLTDWFNTTLAHHRQIGARGMAPYTCPSCRLPARTPPVQNFSLKRIVRLAAESRGESSPRRPQAPPPPSMPPMRGRGSARRDSPPGPFDIFFWR